MAKKIALQGFSRVKLFPLIKNDENNYEVGESFSLPWAQELSKEVDKSESKIYADDGLYLNMKSWNGINCTLTLAEMGLEIFEKLGFGKYDELENSLVMKPQGENKSFAMTFRSLRADGEYRMQKMYIFTVNEIKESSLKTKGTDGSLQAYQIEGVFTSRKLDDTPGEIKDGSNILWLDTIETV